MAAAFSVARSGHGEPVTILCDTRAEADAEFERQAGALTRAVLSGEGFATVPDAAAVTLREGGRVVKRTTAAEIREGASF
jgi:hypothetical protein